MLSISIIILIMCKALINDKLSKDFYHRISAIILLFAGILTYNSIYKLETLSGIGIYSGLFIILSQLLESFLWIINFSYKIINILPISQSLSEKINIFIISLFLHYIIFSLISLGLLGIRIKNNFYYLLERINLSSLFYLFIIIILFLVLNFYLYKYIIYLDDNTTVKMSIQNKDVVLMGNIVTELIEKGGFLGTFVVGARLAGNLLAHHNMNFIPKIGTCVITGTGVAIHYKIMFDTFFSHTENRPIAKIGATIIQAEIATPVKREDFIYLYNHMREANEKSSIFNTIFNTNNLFKRKIGNNIEYLNLNPITGKYSIDFIEWIHQLSLKKELGKTQVDWTKDSPMVDPNYKLDTSSFINSPLEISEFNYKIFIELVTNSLHLEFIKMYLLFMLLLIILCKFIIKPESIESNKLNKYKLGRFINKILLRYLNIWQKSSNIWMIFILMMLILFSLTTIIGLNRIKIFLLTF